MAEKEDTPNELLEFIDKNMTDLNSIPDNQGIQLSVLEFLKIHTLFLNVDMAIMAMAEALFDGHPEKIAAFEKFQRIVLSNRQEIDSYFVEVLQRNLEEKNGTTE